MIALSIPDLKQFTSKLFVQETFDSFQVAEISVSTYNTFEINGRMQKGYYSEEELEEKGAPEFSYWKQLRPFCFSIIKGSRLPKSFRIILVFPKTQIPEFLIQVGVSFRPEDIQGLYLNIRYENGALLCVSGTSLNSFTMDKTLDQAWDQMVRHLLKREEIAFEEK